MGFLEFVPLIMIDDTVAIKIDGLEYVRGGIREPLLELLPGHRVITVGIQLMEMDHVRSGIGH